MYENPLLYEINALVWLGELSRTYGKKVTLGNVPSERWDRLKDLDFDYVWLMGVWKRSAEGLRLFKMSPEWPKLRAHLDSILPGWTDDDVAGSPYSIASYTPEPMVGSWDDVDNAREELRKRGIKLILDFVPNHTAPDHPWIFEHPDYYVQGTEPDFMRNPAAFIQVRRGKETLYIARGKDPYFPPWPDTAQLNYFNPEVHFAMTNELKKVAEHCDGVRCDMAMLVLNDIFAKNWEWARKSVARELPKAEIWEDIRRSLPGFILIAEAYWDTERRLQQLGFDYVYDKKLYDLLRAASAPDVTRHLAAEVSYQKKLVRFIENHDEPRSAGVFDKARLQAAATLFSTVPGMRLYYHGQIEGRTEHIPMPLRRVKDETPVESAMAFYKKLLSIVRSDAFHSGAWELKETEPAGDDSFRDLVAYLWRTDDHMKLVVVNLGPGRSQGRISLRRELADDYEYVLRDELNGRDYVRSGKAMAGAGLHVVLAGFQSHIFDIARR